MKALHRPDLFTWSRFDEARNVDFHGTLWTRPGGNVAIDPLPLSPHDAAHLAQLGGVGTIVITNSDHVRGAVELAAATGAVICAPAAERGVFTIHVDRWLSDGDVVVPGLRALAIDGSKTPGELLLVLDESTVIAGDVLRAHKADSLHLLPPDKLKDVAAARASLRRLLEFPVEAILVGDGWPIFRDGRARLAALLG
jgi:glyoxylase-like metal-dependent hydrolase (beta-lactamase superfamily II)